MSKLADLDRLYNAVNQQKGRIDVLFTNAGLKTELSMSDEQIEEFKAQVAATTPLGRAGTPEEIAKAVVFRASDESSYVNGIELFVDDGMAQI